MQINPSSMRWTVSVSQLLIASGPQFVGYLMLVLCSPNHFPGRKRGDTALHVACYVGDDRTNIVEALLNGPQVPHELLYRCTCLKMKYVRFRQGAAVLNSHATLDGATALMRCCESNAVECVKARDSFRSLASKP